MKLLKKKILFALASEVDFVNQAHGYDYQTYKFLYFRLSEFRKGSIRDAVNRLNRDGLVDKLAKNRQSLIRLTSQGRDKLLRELGVNNNYLKKWDGVWRMVIVSANLDGDSRALEGKLSDLGYKRVNRGVFLAPISTSAPTKELFLESQWLGKGRVMEIKKLVVGDDRQIAGELWYLEKMGDKYTKFITLADRVLKLSHKSVVLINQSKWGFKQVFNSYFSLLVLDPRLPDKLLPPNWPAEKAGEMFLRLALVAKAAKV